VIQTASVVAASDDPSRHYATADINALMTAAVFSSTLYSMAGFNHGYARHDTENSVVYRGALQ
jgi:hypothetical protein